MTDAERIAFLEEENAQLRQRIAALTQGATTDKQHALQLHLAFRKAAEVPQTREWTDPMKEAWFILYEAITSDDFGLKLLAEKLNERYRHDESNH